MPTIDVRLSDLCDLLGERLDLDEVDRRLELVKGELKRGADDEEFRVELQDTNRPDLWCIEGIARQIRFGLQEPQGWRSGYGFFERQAALAGRIEVDASVQEVRPFVAGFLARGWEVDDAGLRAFIQVQETLSRNYGRKRATIAIGIYDGAQIEFPVVYKAVGLDDPEAAFVPLPPADEAMADVPSARWQERWTPAEILRDHPTGKEYRAALAGDRAPLLIDSRGEVLSFPPIINSAGLGRVVEGMSELFVEVTGTTLDQVLLATNILAANMRDRGSEILPVATRYSFETPRGREVIAPHALPEKRVLALPLERFRSLLGEEELPEADVVSSLERYGLEVRSESDLLRIEAPPYRADYLHEVDAVEDYAISRGYDRFSALMPEEFTVGRLEDSTLVIDRARDRMIGYGFEEAICNILTSSPRIRGAMNLGPDDAGIPGLQSGAPVRIANVMNENYACVRDWVLPSLLEIESHSAGAVYPHRIFEAGEVAVADADAPLRSRTEQRIGALIAAESANFTEAQGYVHLLLEHLGVQGATLEACEHGSFLPGRVALIRMSDSARVVGLIGEIHPEVLAGEKGFGIRVPCAAFELSLSACELG
jgi:phenylalanyl-tRNA synthetase beta chain